MRLSLALLAAFAAFSAIAIPARRAAAYPQFRFSLDEDRCGACHFAPSGGGLINDYGRDEAGTVISRGGDGRLLNGLWTPPDWLALGTDERFAIGDKQVAGRGETLAFPMQFDLYARATTGALSVSVTVGLRGAARDPAPPLLDRVVSREHYVAYEHGDDTVRAGRFFPVFGLRLPDHTAYVRRFLGFGLLEEPYALELAHTTAATTTEVTAFVPPPITTLGSGYRASGIAITHERQLGDHAALGLQARVARSDDEARATAGAFGTWWMPGAGLLWLAEIDGQRQWIDQGPGRVQIAGYLGVSRWAVRGVLISGALHLWDPDVALRGAARDAAEVSIQYFPRAHLELQLLARASSQGDGLEEPGLLTLLQVHYYP